VIVIVIVVVVVAAPSGSGGGAVPDGAGSGCGPAPFGTTPVPQSAPWSVSTPPPVTPDMGISAIRRCQPTQREGLWGAAVRDLLHQETR